MGLTITIGAQKQVDVAFSDIEAMNDELFRFTDIGELLGDYDNPDFIRVEDGKILFQDRENGSYETRAEVWSCFGLKEAKVIAEHVTAGKLILRMDIEGNEPDWFIIGPGKVEKTKDPF